MKPLGGAIEWKMLTMALQLWALQKEEEKPIWKDIIFCKIGVLGAKT